jgi:integrase
VPFIEIASNEARRIKTAASSRRVPLVGEALWAAKRTVDMAKRGQKYAFPRYSTDGVCKSDAASAAVGKWLRKTGVEKSAHSFRHTIRDRLRNVDAPKEVQDAIGGWGRQEIGQQYGEGYAVAKLAHWLRKLI